MRSNETIRNYLQFPEAMPESGAHHPCITHPFAALLSDSVIRRILHHPFALDLHA